ncbi:glycosyltransferase family 2 protein [Nonomuraea antimicrobica]
MSTGTPRPTIGAVVLTMNDRPAEFTAAMRSLLAQRGVDLDVVVVGNGCVPDQVPGGVRTVELPRNLGIPEGRNVGAANVEGDLIFFFDDDAVLPDPDALLRLATELTSDPRRAFVQPRIADPVTGRTLRRWVPRLRVSHPGRAGTVTVMAEGVVMVRREAFEAVGGWPGHFFLFHEGSTWPGGCGTAGSSATTRPTSSSITPPPTRPATRTSTGSTPATGSGWPCVTCPPRWSRSTWPPGPW